MSSTIFYKFKSQKELSRIFFDGTGITVFDLKREIIYVNKLGTGLDFDLTLYNADTMEELSDDTAVIPRSSSVIARRSPAKNIKASAARYITGKPRFSKASAQAPVHAPSFNSQATENPGQTEEEKIAQMFQNQDNQWREEQVSMSTATPVYNKPSATSTNPDDVPPPGYICYRCGDKNHWIKNCPTNDDPNWMGKKVKRTTGIPRSYLKTVAKPEGEEEDNNGYMITEDGQYVVAIADKKAWETYQKRQANKPEEEYTVSDATLLDPISQKLYKDPVKTPCCSKTYSRQSIENALLGSDFVCPNCKKEDVLLDSLTADKEMAEKVNKFLKEESKKRARDNEGEEGGDAKKPKLIPVGDLPTNPMSMPMVPGMFMPPFMPGMPFPMMMPPQKK